MKLRWSNKDFICKCGKQVKTGELSYLCKCCDTRVCRSCGDPSCVAPRDNKFVKEVVEIIIKHRGY